MKQRDIQESMSYNDKTYITFASHPLDHQYDKKHGHTHHHLEISLIRDGSGVYYINGEKFKAKKGDIFIFNNTDVHGLSMAPGESIVNQVIHFEPWLIWQSPQDFFNDKYLRIFLNRPADFKNRVKACESVSPSIAELFDAMEKEFTEKSTDYELMIKVKLLNILVLLSRHFNCQDDLLLTKPKQRASIEKVITYIHNHFRQAITLKELADLVFMNPSYFSRYFKKYNGLSPMDYVAHLRIRHAVHLLITTKEPVADICYNCGFNSITSFNRTFKRIKGLSPTHYRHSEISH